MHYNPEKLLSLRFYRIHPNVDAAQLSAFLNSTVFWLYFEVFGNKSQGQGVLDFFMADFLRMELPVVLNDRISEAFIELGKRPAKDIFAECGLNPESDVPIVDQDPNPISDRKRLDDLIFDELGLDAAERRNVYTSLCEAVNTRLTKAQSS